MEQARSRTRRVLAAAALGACGLLAMPPSADAAGSISELSVGQGTLLAKGAALRIPTTYACQGFLVSMTFQVRQRTSAGAIAYGTSSAGETSADPLVCDGTTRVVTITVYPNDTAFKPGTALVSVDFYACDEELICSRVTQEAETRLANK